MAKAVFTTKVSPTYDDLPECRYHFPKTYVNQARQSIGDWILYYEPRREDAGSAGHLGRQAYFATARVTKIEPDPHHTGLFYAYVEDYLEFIKPFPFKISETCLESRLQKADGSTNKGAFGRAVRILLDSEYETICGIGFRGAPDLLEVSRDAVTERLTEYEVDRPTKMTSFERPFRDVAFTKIIQHAYGSRCAMTGLQLVNGGGRCEIEAAHIRPVSEKGPDSPRNGIALCRTVHWMFDRGILSIADNGEILMGKKVVPDQIRRVLNPDGKILLPTSPALRPHPFFLRYHREHRFKGN